MRRPLLLATICLVSVMGVLLYLGIFDRTPEGQTGAQALADGDLLTFTGQVYQRDSEKLYIQSVHLISSADISQPAIPCKDNFICIPEQGAEVPLGSIVLARGVFQSFSAATNPGEFDSREYYRTLGIGGRIKNVELLDREDSCWKLREAMCRLRSLLRQRLEKVFPGKEGAVMCALLLGDKTDLDPELKDLYQRNGILHILSISSLHITMIGMTVYKLLRRCRMPVCPAAVAGCVLLFLYGMMTGFSVSACRAIGMYLLRMAAETVGRTYDMPTAMGVTAAVLVVRNPYYLLHAGFLLSFTSMVGIGMVYPSLEAGERRGSRERMLEPVMSGVSITLATLPVQLWFYYQVPVYSILLNIFVLPLMKPLMAAGFLAMIPGLGFCGSADRLILWGYERLCGLVDKFPFHTWNPGKPQLWQVIVYYLVLAAAVWLWRELRNKDGKPDGKGWAGNAERNRIREGGRKAAAAGCLAALFLNLLIIGWRPPIENQILFLDVGQGDGILVRTASGENYLFDCGSSSRSRVGNYVLLPCLRYYGIQTLDAVILSHPDADHVNGVMEVLSMGQENGIRIKQLVLPELWEQGREEMLEQLGQFVTQEDWRGQMPIGYLSAGESFCCDRAEFVCLHPGRGWEGTEPNVYSVCVYGKFMDKNRGMEMDFLLTGDVEGTGETALLEELRDRDLQNVDVLKVAHHGSKNSTMESLLKQTAPALAVISCGRNNRYGHPHQELLERLRDAGSETVSTAEKGAVRVYADCGEIRVEAFGGR